MNRQLNALAALLLAGVLASCGGGGGSPGSTGTGTGTGTDGTGTGTGTGGTTTDPAVAATARVADFALFSDKSSLANTGADNAKITVQAVDANRNVVAGATVSTTTDQESVFVPGSTTTDATGNFTGTLSIGGQKADRDVTVAVTINGITKRTTVHVGGSKLTVSANPVSPQPNQAVAITANLKDSSGQPIAGQTVTFNSAGAGISNRTATTNSTGDATINITAPAAAGVYTISVTGSGTTAPDLQLQVLASGASVPVATIPAGAAPSLSADRTVLPTNAPGSTANKAVLRFLMLDGGNNPVPNVRVRFLDLTTGLPAQGASISSGTSTLFTDPSGSATAQYFSGQNSSSTNGVKIRACYSANDLTATDISNCSSSTPPAGAKFVDTTLTVAGQALAVSIGDDNRLAADPTAGTYTKRFAVTVADSAGRAVPNAPVDIAVDLTHFGKGTFVRPYEANDTSNGLNSAARLSLTQSSQGLDTDPADTGLRSWCPNEDVNRNGNVDGTTVFPGSTSENYNGSTDSNGQPTLEPRKADLLISYDDPTVTATNANGILVVKVTYSQRFGTWLAYKIRVTANVSGSQGLAERLFVTDIVSSDLGTGSFNTPPYGSGACSAPN